MNSTCAWFYKYNILKSNIFKDQNILNMKTATHCFATNSKIFKQDLNNNFLMLQQR